jgi:hypothetical protein
MGPRGQVELEGGVLDFSQGLGVSRGTAEPSRSLAARGRIQSEAARPLFLPQG